MTNDINGNKDTKGFIREKIVKKHSIKKHLLKAGILILSALSFGVLAMAAAVYSEPFLREHLGEPQTETQESIVIPQDEPETLPSMQPRETEPVEDIVQSAIEDYDFDISSLEAMYASLSELASGLDASIVSVRTSNVERDWFDNEIERTGELAGVVIAETEREFLILAPSESVSGAEAITVRFKDDKEYTGAIRSLDPHIHIVLISISKSNLEESTASSVKPVVLGNSYQLRRGDIVMILGAPSGVLYSGSYGTVSYISKASPLVDMNARLVYTNAKVDKSLGSYVFNTKGELVAWMADANVSGVSGQAAFGISDFKSLLERMSNAKTSAYLGIEGSDVEDRLQDAGVEAGVYIKNVVADSPAYNAGIQPGDILVELGDSQIKTMSDYKNSISTLQIEETVQLGIMRYGRDEYVRLDFDVVVGAR